MFTLQLAWERLQERVEDINATMSCIQEVRLCMRRSTCSRSASHACIRHGPVPAPSARMLPVCLCRSGTRTRTRLLCLPVTSLGNSLCSITFWCRVQS